MKDEEAQHLGHFSRDGQRLGRVREETPKADRMT